MQTWIHASSGDLKRYRAIAQALENHPDLLRFLFRTDKAELNAPPKTLLARSRALSAGESILVRLSLDLWSESGALPMLDLLRLDPETLGTRFERLHIGTESNGRFCHDAKQAILQPD